MQQGKKTTAAAVVVPSAATAADEEDLRRFADLRNRAFAQIEALGVEITRTEAGNYRFNAKRVLSADEYAALLNPAYRSDTSERIGRLYDEQEAARKYRPTSPPEVNASKKLAAEEMDPGPLKAAQDALRARRGR